MRFLKNRVVHLGASPRNILCQVVDAESKRFASQMKQDTRVSSELREGMQAEEARYRHARVEYIEQMKLKTENKLARDALKETDRKPKKAKRDVKQQEKALAAIMHSRSYTLPMFGAGHKNGGTQRHAKNRGQVLEQVREVGELSPQHQFQWMFFKTAWDESMAACHTDN